MDKTSTKRQEAVSQLSWVGDNLGQDPGAQFTIVLQDETGDLINASVASTLILSNRIKADERQRILSALRHYAEAGELHPADMQAFMAWESTRLAKETCNAAALRVSEVAGLLYMMKWAGDKCEDSHDFEQFHVLALALMPQLGAKLEGATVQMGIGGTGLFEAKKEACHA